MKIISKKDKGRTIEVNLHELFAVEVDASHPDNEFLAVPAFIQEQNFEIIKEYAYTTATQSSTQVIGKKIYLLMATRISEVDMSWFNLSTAKEELSFILRVTSYSQLDEMVHHLSDNDTGSIPSGR